MGGTCGARCWCKRKSVPDRTVLRILRYATSFLAMHRNKVHRWGRGALSLFGWGGTSSSQSPSSFCDLLWISKPALLVSDAVVQESSTSGPSKRASTRPTRPAATRLQSPQRHRSRTRCPCCPGCHVRKSAPVHALRRTGAGVLHVMEQTQYKDLTSRVQPPQP